LFIIPLTFIFFLEQGNLFSEVIKMAKMKKDPSKAGVSAASVRGNAGPGGEQSGIDKQNSQNNQFKKR
jgi:hypothetical protein